MNLRPQDFFCDLGFCFEYMAVSRFWENLENLKTCFTSPFCHHPRRTTGRKEPTMTDATPTIDLSFFYRRVTSARFSLLDQLPDGSVDLSVRIKLNDGSSTGFFVDHATCPDAVIQRILDEDVELGDYETVARARLEKLFEEAREEVEPFPGLLELYAKDALGERDGMALHRAVRAASERLTLVAYALEAAEMIGDPKELRGIARASVDELRELSRLLAECEEVMP